MLVALDRMWRHSGDSTYLKFVVANLLKYIDSSGQIRTYMMEDYNLDNIGPGRAVLAAYDATGDARFRKAAATLHRQLEAQPRTHEGGFWHKKIYPYQMWLDGLFMAGPFRAMYASRSGAAGEYDDIVNQFVWIASHTTDRQTGLLYHAWDERRQERWANPATGCSPNFWSRAIGWYMMALVDVLEYLPQEHPRRGELEVLLRDVSDAVLKFRDERTRLWMQVTDQGHREGNYPEASASCMFVYAFAKGVREGVLGESFLTAATESFEAVVALLTTTSQEGYIDLRGTCRGAGLGGTPYRDGSYEYYIGEPQRTNDLKGIGAFLLAAIELESSRPAGGK